MVIPLKDENPTRRTPVLTILLIGANVFVFFFLQPGGIELGFQRSPAAARAAAVEEQLYFLRHAVIPCELVRGEPLTVDQIRRGDCDAPSLATDARPFPEKNVVLALFASMFLHGSLLHLGGNMLFLWIFGNNIEDRFGISGYALFYVVTGVVATLAHVATDLGSTVPLVGASGAIAGVMGAYLVYFPHARILSIVPIFFIIHVVRLPASLVLGIWFVMQFLTNPNAGIAWAAHVGGFLAGAAIAWVLPRRPPSPPRQTADGWAS